MKKIMLLSILFVSFGFVPHVLAQSGFVPLAPIPGLTQGVTADQAGLASFFNNLYKYLIGLAAALAVIMITWGGLEIAMNKDDVSKITDSKGRIYNAIFGLVLVLSPVLVFSIINPSILNLSLNLPALDTKFSTPTVATSTQQAVKPGTILNATKVGQTVGLSDGYYPQTQATGYCYSIVPFADSTQNNTTENYFCSASPTGCSTTLNGALKLDPNSDVGIPTSGTSCQKY